MQTPTPELRLQLSEFVVRRATVDDAALALAYQTRNREHLAPYAPARPDTFYTLAHWQTALAQADEQFHSGQRASCCIARRDGSAIVGEINLSNFVRGAFQACYLGYSVELGLQGSGLMTRAVEAVLQYAFGELHLHRVMANYIPSNARSARLLQRLGFQREGFAPSYLLIAGRWQDHVLTARTNPDWTPPPAS